MSSFRVALALSVLNSRYRLRESLAPWAQLECSSHLGPSKKLSRDRSAPGGNLLNGPDSSLQVDREAEKEECGERGSKSRPSSWSDSEIFLSKPLLVASKHKAL